MTSKQQERERQAEMAKARRIVREALRTGYVVRLHDGEEWATEFTRSRSEVNAALRSTDEERLVIRSADGTERIGSVLLIWGNGAEDLVADYAAPNDEAFARMEALLDAARAWD